MGHLIGKEYLLDTVLEAAKKIVLAIHKAPQITGKTQVEAEILWGEDLIPILEVMEPVAKAVRYVHWDYQTIKGCLDKGESPVIIAIGGKVDRSNLGWDCGACGHATCKDFNAYAKDMGGGGQLGGPCCNWKVMDFAIACDWACAAAWQYRIDNRIMGSIAFGLQALNYLPGYAGKMGLALGPPRDMVYYSREEMHRRITYEEEKLDMLRSAPNMFTCFPGGGNPMYKTKDEWWAPPDYLSAGYSDEVMEALNTILYEQIPLVVEKHAGAVAARYEK